MASTATTPPLPTATVNSATDATTVTSPPAHQLKLFGTWSSSYTHRVQLALKLKALSYDFAEEDLSNKSPELLTYNPVYKKVPVLVHAGRPLVESAIILQYLDDVWPDTYKVVPQDPYDRAVARFWCHFVDDKLGPAVGEVFKSTGTQQKEAISQVHNYLRMVESELSEGAFKGRRFFGGDRVGLLDIVLGCGSYWLWALEEVENVRLVDPEVFPLFSAWLRDFESQEEVRETIPPADRLLEYARALRQMILSFAATAIPVDDAAGEDAAATAKDTETGGGGGHLAAGSAGNAAVETAHAPAADQAVMVGGASD